MFSSVSASVLVAGSDSESDDGLDVESLLRANSNCLTGQTISRVAALGGMYAALASGKRTLSLSANLRRRRLAATIPNSSHRNPRASGDSATCAIVNDDKDFVARTLFTTAEDATSKVETDSGVFFRSSMRRSLRMMYDSDEGSAMGGSSDEAGSPLHSGTPRSVSRLSGTVDAAISAQRSAKRRTRSASASGWSPSDATPHDGAAPSLMVLSRCISGASVVCGSASQQRCGAQVNPVSSGTQQVHWNDWAALLQRCAERQGRASRGTPPEGSKVPPLFTPLSDGHSGLSSSFSIYLSSEECSQSSNPTGSYNGIMDEDVRLHGAIDALLR